MANSVDERLLNRGEEYGAAGELRNRKRSSSAEATAGKGGEGTAGELQSYRQRIMRAKQAMNLKEQAKKKLEEKALSPLKQLTTKALFNSWWIILFTGGAGIVWSFFYINIHVFGRWVLGDQLFCKLGEEWLPKQITQAGPSASSGQGGNAAEPVTKGAGLIEVIVLLILDLLVLFVILGVLALIVMIIQFMQQSWFEKVGTVLQVFWDTGWGTMKALYDLFNGLDAG